MDKKFLNTMFDCLLHIWNKTNYWSPKMKPYIYGSVNWIHVINLVKTFSKLEEIKSELRELVGQWKKILFVATKLQARDAFSKLSLETWHYYVTEKWVPWLLTNFKTIRRGINTYLKLANDNKNWVFDSLTKKEKALKLLELEKLDRAFRWLKEMKKVPEVIFVVDGVFEKQSLKEANSLNLLSYAIFNTNWNESQVKNMIPSNTNSVRGFEFLASELKAVLSWIKPIPKTNDNLKNMSNTDKNLEKKKELGITKKEWEKEKVVGKKIEDKNKEEVGDKSITSDKKDAETSPVWQIEKSEWQVKKSEGSINKGEKNIEIKDTK